MILPPQTHWKSQHLFCLNDPQLYKTWLLIDWALPRLWWFLLWVCQWGYFKMITSNHEGKHFIAMHGIFPSACMNANIKKHKKLNLWYDCLDHVVKVGNAISFKTIPEPFNWVLFYLVHTLILIFLKLIFCQNTVYLRTFNTYRIYC